MGNSLDFLHGVETQEVLTATGAIQTATSSIIGVLGTAGKGPVNIPTLVAGNPREGVAKFGVFGADGFTIPEALSGIFAQIGAMVICVNVCNPLIHSSNVVNEAVVFGRNFVAQTSKPYVSDLTIGNTFTGKVPVSAAGVVLLPPGCTITAIKSLDGTKTYVSGTDYTPANGTGSTAPNQATAKGSGAFAASTYVNVTYTAGVAENVDYTVNYDTGAVSRLNSGKILNGASGTASYTYVDPTKVTDVNIIGGVDAADNYVGASAFLGAEDATALVPRILIAPHWTHQKADAITANPTVAALLSVAQDMKSVIYADGPNTVDEDAVNYRGDWGSDRIMVVDPWAKIEGPNGQEWLVPASVYWAGITAQTDNAIGFWASPSNKEIAGIIGTGRTVDFRMGSTTCRANYLNSQQVSTIIRKQGYRTWGNHGTGIEPATTFFTARRTADMVEVSIQESMLWAVDRVITKNFLEEVLANVGAYLRHLQQVGAIYGGSAWIDRALNTDDVIASGQLYINYDFTVPKTAEHITFIASVSDNYISNIFQDLKLTLANTSVINVTTIEGFGA